MYFQDLIIGLQEFWAKRGCVIVQPYNSEVGAGTYNPSTFLRAIGPEPWNVAFVEPSRRPTDGRYGDNPNRLQQFHQYQVILKPAPLNLQELSIWNRSWRPSAPNPLAHDRPLHRGRLGVARPSAPGDSAGRSGSTAWKSRQFTYFQQVGGVDCRPVAGELTYGLERIAHVPPGYRQRLRSSWYRDGREATVRSSKRAEWEWSTYNFEEADVVDDHFAGLRSRYEKPRPSASSAATPKIH